MSGEVMNNFQMTNFTTPNSISSMKYSLNSVPGLAYVGVPHGVEDGPELHPDVWRVRKIFLMTNLTMPNNISSMY